MRYLSPAIVVGLLALCALAPSRAAQEPVPLNDYTRLGQRFTAAQPFTGIWVTVPSWSDAEGGLTLTLWSSPQRTRRLAQKAFSNIVDNARVDLPVRKALPAGTYYWEIDQRTGETRIGLYAEILDADTADCAYLDGAPNPKRRFLSGTLPGPSLTAAPRKLVAVLRSGASIEDRMAACRQLAVVGTPEAIPVLAGLLADEKLSHMARYALERMPGPAVDAALRGALPKLQGKLLVGVINSIGVRRDTRAAGPLGKLLGRPDPDVASAAAAALGRIGTPAAAGALEKALASAPPALLPALYEGSLECAHGLLGRGQRQKAVALYDRLRAPEAPAVIRVAAMRGAILARGPDGLPLLLEQLRGADANMAGAALWVVPRELPGAKVTEALAAALPSLPVERQPALIQALARRGDGAAVPSLAAAAASGTGPVRIAALRALPELDPAAAVPVLLKALSGADAEVSRAAREGLAGLPGQEAAAAATSLLSGTEARSRLAGVELVLGRRLSRFAPALLAPSRDADAQVRSAALKALGELAGADALPGLLDVLAGAGEAQEAEAAEQALAAVCARAGDVDACAEKVVGRLAQAPSAQRAALLRVLGAVGGARALQAVRGALADADVDVKATALQVLCGWKTPDAAPDILALARDAATPGDRVRGLRGCLRMAGDSEVPADQRLSLCRDAAGLVQRDEERKLLLSALGGIPSPEALALVLPHLDDAATKEEAGAAALAIAAKLAAGPDAARAVEALEKVVQAAASPDLVKRAQTLLREAQAKAGGK